MTELMAQIQPSGVNSTRLSAASTRLINGGGAGQETGVKAAARKAAEEFETVFLNNMLQSMFEGIKAEAPFGGGYGEQVFRSMMVSEYAKDIAASGGIGLSDDIYREILAHQEGRSR